MSRWVTDEDAIIRLVVEAKAQYTQFKRFYDFCKVHMRITDVDTFKRVYWDDEVTEGKITEVRRSRKNDKKE